jgi:RNase P subunit RPR2
MSTLELNLYQMLKTDLNISDERAKRYIEVLEEIQESKIKEVSNEYRSIFKEDLYKVETNLKNEINTNTRWIIGIIFGLALMIIGMYMKK